MSNFEELRIKNLVAIKKYDLAFQNFKNKCEEHLKEIKMLQEAAEILWAKISEIYVFNGFNSFKIKCSTNFSAKNGWHLLISLWNNEVIMRYAPAEKEIIFPKKYHIEKYKICEIYMFLTDHLQEILEDMAGRLVKEYEGKKAFDTD